MDVGRALRRVVGVGRQFRKTHVIGSSGSLLTAESAPDGAALASRIQSSCGWRRIPGCIRIVFAAGGLREWGTHGKNGILLRHELLHRVQDLSNRVQGQERPAHRDVLPTRSPLRGWPVSPHGDVQPFCNVQPLRVPGVRGGMSERIDAYPRGGRNRSTRLLKMYRM